MRMPGLVAGMATLRPAISPSDADRPAAPAGELCGGISAYREGVTVSEGQLSPGLPYLRLGHGPPLVLASGLTARHANPTGVMRRGMLSAAAPFAQDFTVYLVNRKAGLAPGATMSDIAGHYATAIEHDIGEPVMLHGTSTGGSVALQLALDHPHLVRRLVLASAACRLGPQGRYVQAELARLVQAGRLRQAYVPSAEVAAPRALRYPARAAAWLFGPLMLARDPSDMLITIAAEDAFDAEPSLGKVTAPTLVLGGSADPFYTEDLFRRTAAGVPYGRCVIFRGKGHLYAAVSAASARTSLGFLLAP
jgi:pimeloyl-ACP methyl ester carboxylesterase